MYWNKYAIGTSRISPHNDTAAATAHRTAVLKPLKALIARIMIKIDGEQKDFKVPFN